LVDTYHLALQIKQRATRIARVDRGVGLDDISCAEKAAAIWVRMSELGPAKA
jgi:hypothetical protein